MRLITSIVSRYVIHEPQDGEWGVRNENGHFTGIVGSLEREEGDLSMVLTPTPDRLEVMDHSRIYSEGAFVIISLKPQPSPPTWAFVESFTGNVESYITAAIINKVTRPTKELEPPNRPYKRVCRSYGCCKEISNKQFK